MVLIHDNWDLLGPSGGQSRLSEGHLNQLETNKGHLGATLGHLKANRGLLDPNWVHNFTRMGYFEANKGHSEAIFGHQKTNLGLSKHVELQNGQFGPFRGQVWPSEVQLAPFKRPHGPSCGQFWSYWDNMTV